MRWGAVIAGAVLAIGLWILLQTLGMGLGLAAVRTDDAGSLKSVGIGTGIWSLIAPLIAMFLGALVAGRLATTHSRGVGAIHGSVMWALATAIGLWVMVSVVSGVVSGAAHAGGAAARVTTQAVSGAVGAVGENRGQVMSALGINADDLLGPINEKLDAQGKPHVTAQELEATLQAVARRGLRDGKLDREVLVDELSRNTALSRADAEDLANRFGDKYQNAASGIGARARELGEKAKHVGLQAADVTGKALLAGGIMMLLSLGASLLGGSLGVRRDGRDDVRRRTTYVSPTVGTTETVTTHMPPPDSGL